MRIAILVVILAPALLGCASRAPVQRELIVAPAPVACAGAPAATCLNVSEPDGDTWQMEFDEIEGFAYEPGYTYRVLVEEPPLNAEFAVVPQLSLVRVLSEEPADDGADSSPLGRNAWRLWSISGASGEQSWSDSGITAAFYAAGWVDGFAGCNDYLGALTVDGQKLTIAEPATTLDLCAESVEDRQRTYLEALTKAQSYGLTGDSLELTLSDGGKMRFRAAAG